MSARVEHLAENVTLHLSDAREVVSSLSAIELVITDPPYSSGARRDSERQVRGSMLRSMEDQDWFSHDAMTSWGFGWFIRGLFSDIRPRLTQGAHVYCFIDWRQTPTLYGMLEASGFRVNHCLVWDKQHFGMGQCWRNQHENIVFASNGTPADMLDRGMGSVLRCAAVNHQTRVHPTQKPVDVLVELTRAVPGKIVFDPFMGSGSTGVAAVRVDRGFVGAEINPAHFDTACRRIADELKRPRLFREPDQAPEAKPDLFAEAAE